MDMNPETVQQRIQIARRDAEALKDRIKRKKDELADTTREFCSSLSTAQLLFETGQIALLHHLASIIGNH